jgi:hypothetical protein
VKRFFIGWNLFRVARLLFGLAALVQGVVQREGLVLAAGSWILFGAVFNLGCCGSGGCTIPTATQKTKEEVVYEEVDVSK